MASIQQVRNALPPFRNQKEIIKQKQGTDDIIKEVLKTHELYEADYDRIYQLFDTGNIYITANDIFNFLKYNLVYNEESKEEQSVKSPAAILHPGERIDCKHFSLFSGGLADAIVRNEGDLWTWCYRFASDKPGAREATHVFVVIFNGNKEIWIDPCMMSFDYRQRWNYFIDKQPMSLVRISGTTPQSPLITVDKNLAWSNFLSLITLNFLGIKDILKTGSGTTYTLLHQYCMDNGFDFDQVVRFINS